MVQAAQEPSRKGVQRAARGGGGGEVGGGAWCRASRAVPARARSRAGRARRVSSFTLAFSPSLGQIARMNSYWLSRTGSSDPEGPFSFSDLEAMDGRGVVDASARVCLVNTEDWRLWREEFNEAQQERRERARVEAARAYHAGGGSVPSEPRQSTRSWLFWLLIGGSAAVFLVAVLLAGVSRQEKVEDDGKILEAATLLFRQEMEEIGIDVRSDVRARRVELVLSPLSARTLSDYDLKVLAQKCHSSFKGHLTVVVKDDLGNELSRADSRGASVSR